jgi:hypothetical protein
MDTTALIILGSVISIGMLLLGVLNYVAKKTEADNATAIQTAQLEKDIQYIKTQLANIETLITLNNNDYKELKKELCEKNQILEQRVLNIEMNYKIEKEEKLLKE